MSDTTKPRSLTSGFFDRRIRWGPTWRGWLLLLAAVIVAAGITVRLVHPFLALNRPVAADVLVVEGWIPEYAIQQTAILIRAGKYSRILTVGGPISGAPSPANDDDTYAYVAVRKFHKLGLERPVVDMVPTNHASRDRTFQYAMDLRRRLQKDRFTPAGINVVTLGPHARRTRLLFERALGPSVPVGVIALRNQDYDPARWWGYSEGVKEVVAESVAYLYARFLFSPGSG